MSEADITDVTVVIPVKNEEQNLGRCLARLGRFARVVVIDSASSDRTVEVARAAGAEVIQFDWNGRYPKKRNWYLINHPPTTPWVLFLDADELVDNDFCNELAHAITNSSHHGYWLNYSTYFLGKRLRFGLPQRKLALIRAGRALYEHIDEVEWSRLDMEVHEHPVVEGSVGEIGTAIEHNDDRGIERFIERHLEYAQWEARRYLEFEGSVNTAPSTLTRRQRFKYGFIDRWWYPWSYFAYVYLARLGILDGVAGFYYAYYKCWYFLTVRLTIHEFRRKALI